MGSMTAPAKIPTPAQEPAAPVAPPAAARLPIVLAPAPILKARARPVLPTDDIGELAQRMLATMYAAPGIGLAAPQVDQGLRLAVIDLKHDAETPEGRSPLVLVNPEITRVSQQLVVMEEGCLSLPTHYAEVERPDMLRLRYTDLAGMRHEIDADGLLARCILHEVDHLDGVLFIDHISALKRNMILRKMAKDRRA
jgi:peptide deformylase